MNKDKKSEVNLPSLLDDRIEYFNSSLCKSKPMATQHSYKSISEGSQLDASTIQCRIQYLDDIDPFSTMNLPEPSRPPLFTFDTSVILSYQLINVHQTLKAPHQVNQ